MLLVPATRPFVADVPFAWIVLGRTVHRSSRDAGPELSEERGVVLLGLRGPLSVALHGDRGVAELAGDDGGGRPLDEVAQGAVPASAQVDAERSESDGEGVGVQVLPGSATREQPRAPGVCGAAVGQALEVLQQELRERVGDCGGFVAEQEDRSVGGGEELVAVQGGDADEWLGVERQQDGRDAVGERVGLADQATTEPVEPLLVGDGGRGARVATGELDVGGCQTVAAGPGEEGADERPGGRPAGDPLVEVGLGAGLERGVVLVQPGQQPADLGDLLLGQVDAALGAPALGQLRRMART